MRHDEGGIPPGTRIELVAMGDDDPDPIPPGTRGTVTRHIGVGGPIEQISVDWDIPRSLALVPGVDRFRILTDEEET